MLMTITSDFPIWLTSVQEASPPSVHFGFLSAQLLILPSLLPRSGAWPLTCVSVCVCVCGAYNNSLEPCVDIWSFFSAEFIYFFPSRFWLSQSSPNSDQDLNSQRPPGSIHLFISLCDLDIDSGPDTLTIRGFITVVSLLSGTRVPY